MSLLPCPSCSRHVRTTDRACPFCRTAIALEPAVPVIGERLGRAAIFAFGAAMVTNVAACSMSTTPGNDAASPGNDAAVTEDAFTPPGDAGTDAFSPNPDAGVFPPYGAPPEDTGPPDDAGPDTGGFIGAYGAPPSP